MKKSKKSNNKFSDWLHWFFADKNGKIVIAQTANPPLIAWMMFTIATIISRKYFSEFTLFFQAGASLSIIYWSLLEMFSGDSPWRKTLGLIIYTFSISGIISSLL